MFVMREVVEPHVARVLALTKSKNIPNISDEKALKAFSRDLWEKFYPENAAKEKKDATRKRKKPENRKQKHRGNAAVVEKDKKNRHKQPKDNDRGSKAGRCNRVLEGERQVEDFFGT